ncbi:unnamed protein product, partial [Ectocarpus sp. 12 AP-2014]
IFRDLGDAKRILRELKLLRHFRPHENVVTILDIMIHPENSLDFRDVYIVTNLMESDLQKIISSTQPLIDQHFHYFLYQLLRGLKYIHSANVLHRDLKPSNLVLNANCDLAICDFGLSRGVEQEGGETLTEYVQTRWYRAPELLCYSSTYDTAVDMWSVGCIFAELLGRKPFFRGKNPMHQLQMIVDVLGCPSEEEMSFIQDKAARAVVLQHARQAVTRRGTGGVRPLAVYFPTDTSPLALDLLAKMLVFNPRRRIGVVEALEHPYLADLHAQMVGKEPKCEKIFDFDFEKEGGGSSDRLVPKKQRVIPRGELKALVLEELLVYRPSAQGENLLAVAKQAAEGERQQRLRQSASPGSWSNSPGLDAMDASGYEALSPAAQMSLGGLSPMDGVGPGMITPTPGVHGYSGAVSYGSAVPPQDNSRATFQQPQQQQRWQQQQQQQRRSMPQPQQQTPYYPSSSASQAASPAAVAAAVAAATAAAASSSATPFRAHQGFGDGHKRPPPHGKR